MDCSFPAVAFWSHFVVDWYEYTDMTIAEHHGTGCWAGVFDTRLVKSSVHKFAWIIAGVFYGVYCCMAQANGCGGAAVSQHLIWPVCEAHHACLSVCKLACEFNITVTLLMAFSWCGQSWRTHLLWPVHPRAISNIKGIYVPYDALCCNLYHGWPLWYRHCSAFYIMVGRFDTPMQWDIVMIMLLGHHNIQCVTVCQSPSSWYNVYCVFTKFGVNK